MLERPESAVKEEGSGRTKGVYNCAYICQKTPGRINQNPIKADFLRKELVRLKEAKMVPNSGCVYVFTYPFLSGVV